MVRKVVNFHFAIVLLVLNTVGCGSGTPPKPTGPQTHVVKLPIIKNATGIEVIPIHKKNDPKFQLKLTNTWGDILDVDFVVTVYESRVHENEKQQKKYSANRWNESEVVTIDGLDYFEYLNVENKEFEHNMPNAKIRGGGKTAKGDIVEIDVDYSYLWFQKFYDR